MISSLLTTSMATTDLTLKPIQGTKITFMRYLKVMPVTLPTIAYKLATLTIVSTISGLWIIIQHLIVLPCISLVLLIFLSWRLKIVNKLHRHVLGPRTFRLLSMCSNSFTMPMNTLWSNQNKNVQVKMMRCTVWLSFLLNGVTLVMCYMLKEQDFWFSHIMRRGSNRNTVGFRPLTFNLL